MAAQKMSLVIFGATGNTGKLLVEQALAAGNQVVAYVRNPAKLDMQSERLTKYRENWLTKTRSRAL